VSVSMHLSHYRRTVAVTAAAGVDWLCKVDRRPRCSSSLANAGSTDPVHVSTFWEGRNRLTSGRSGDSTPRSISTHPCGRGQPSDHRIRRVQLACDGGLRILVVGVGHGRLIFHCRKPCKPCSVAWLCYSPSG
jgi:hypothetical protein